MGLLLQTKILHVDASGRAKILARAHAIALRLEDEELLRGVDVRRLGGWAAST
jgi:hypothetical protein